MALQRRHLLALLVSAAAHLGLWFAIGSPTYREAAPVPPGERAVLVVLLAQPDRYAMTASAPALPHGGQAEPVLARPKHRPLAQRPPEQAPVQPAPRYFPLRSLTQAPRVASGLIGDALLVVPGIEAQGATILVWISDQGEVDRVAIEDADLPEESRQRVIAALSAVRFYPGKIGRIAVSSEMRMDILLESELKL